MSLRSPTEDEIALTLALSHRNGRGNFSVPNSNSRSSSGHFLPSPALRERERVHSTPNFRRSGPT
jgi:hypothetical protein